MEIYKLDNDLLYKNITGIDEVTIAQFSNFKGQKLSENWTVPKLDLLENITNVKSEKSNEMKKQADFDLRCYGNILLVKSKYLDLFSTFEIEFLPVTITSLNENFSFGNVSKIIEAINFENMDYQQSMAMLKSNEINFNKNNIATSLLFRDKK